jgi:hypothetical protein
MKQCQYDDDKEGNSSNLGLRRMAPGHIRLHMSEKKHKYCFLSRERDSHPAGCNESSRTRGINARPIIKHVADRKGAIESAQIRFVAPRYNGKADAAKLELCIWPSGQLGGQLTSHRPFDRHV